MYIYTMGKSTIQRQKIIADLIDEGKITSQNQLKGILNKKGIPITQATLSRDLSEIGATKKRNALYKIWEKACAAVPLRANSVPTPIPTTINPSWLFKL